MFSSSSLADAVSLVRQQHGRKLGSKEDTFSSIPLFEYFFSAGKKRSNEIKIRPKLYQISLSFIKLHKYRKIGKKIR
jgi:hypothetical protein